MLFLIEDAQTIWSFASPWPRAYVNVHLNMSHMFNSENITSFPYAAWNTAVQHLRIYEGICFNAREKAQERTYLCAVPPMCFTKPSILIWAGHARCSDSLINTVNGLNYTLQNSGLLAFLKHLWLKQQQPKKSHEYCYLILGNRSRKELKRSVNLPVYSFHFPWVVHYLHKYPQSSVKDVVIALQIYSLGERNICILNHHYWVCQRENVCIKALCDPSAATTTGNIIKLV